MFGSSTEDENQRLLHARDLHARASAAPLDLERAAAAAHMLPAHFTRKGRPLFREPPRRYLQHRRIERACTRLRNSRESVTDIAGPRRRREPRLARSLVHPHRRMCAHRLSPRHDSWRGVMTDQHPIGLAQGALGMAVNLTTDDCAVLHAEPTVKGPAFAAEPTEQPYGIDCALRDPFGNHIRSTQLTPMQSITDDELRPRASDARHDDRTWDTGSRYGRGMYEPRHHHVTTRDGRVLAGTSVGPSAARPVLFVAGAATGGSMSFGIELLDELGARLVTMDRAGMGASTVDPGRTLAGTADDYRTFVDGVLGSDAGAVPVVANSQGAVFGLRIALDGTARRLVLVSPADELAHPAVHDMLPPAATALADLAAENPEAASAVLHRFTPEAMEEMVLAGSDDDDAAFYTSAAFRPRYREALAEGFANGGAGYVTDTLIAMRPWGMDLARIACPVKVLFGARDGSHSPDLGACLTSRIPTATRTVFDDAGGALLWTHARTVLEAALAD